MSKLAAVKSTTSWEQKAEKRKAKNQHKNLRKLRKLGKGVWVSAE